MPKQKKSKIPNTIQDVLKLQNRKFVFDLLPLTQPSDVAKCSHMAAKDRSRDKQIKFFETYKTNNELLNFILQPIPKTRSPSSVLKPTPVNQNSGSSFKNKSNQGPHIEHSLPPPKSTRAFITSRRNSEGSKAQNTRRPFPLNVASNPSSSSSNLRTQNVSEPAVATKVKLQATLTGIVHGHCRGPSAPSYCFYDVRGEESSEAFYDIESSSRRF